MVKKLYLVRHGETEGAQSNRYKGHIDVPLSGKGIRQMERLAKYIYQNPEHRACLPDRQAQNTELKAVYTSDLSRAVKSAEIISEPYNIKPIIVRSLRERNFGIWEGMSFDEIKDKYPREFEAWVGNPLKFSPMKGESTLKVKDRALDALNKILNNHIRQNTDKSPPTHPSPSRGEGKGGGENLGSGLCNPGSESIAIVAHGGINRIILCHLLGIPLENIFRIEQDFGALNIVEFHDDYPVVKLINCIIEDYVSDDFEERNCC
ncbi:MAG: histidine phosphatase family protein [Candidatus Mariimomonas ferrooxydans]